MENKKVSILIPMYNAENYVRSTLESAVAQTYKNIEIIVVDDGSTDNGFMIVKEYEIEFENVKVYLQENKGASAARNKAFEMSSGEYIQYLDGDDILDSKKIEMQMTALKDCDEETVVFAKVGNFKDDIRDTVFRNESINKNHSEPLQYLLDSWSRLESAITVSWLTPRKLIEKVKGWDENLSKNDDGEFFARIVYHASELIYVPKSVAYYRVGNSSSLSNNMSKKAEISRLNSYNVYMELVEDHLDNPKVRKALAILYSAYIYSIYPLFPDLIAEAQEKLKQLGFKNPVKNSKNICRPLYSIIGFYNAVRVCKFLKSLFR